MTIQPARLYSPPLPPAPAMSGGVSVLKTPGFSVQRQETPQITPVNTPDATKEIPVTLLPAGISPVKAGLVAGLGLAGFYWLTSIRRFNLMALLTFLGAAGIGVGTGFFRTLNPSPKQAEPAEAISIG